jgi:hypothetical protein
LRGGRHAGYQVCQCLSSRWQNDRECLSWLLVAFVEVMVLCRDR